MLVIKKENYLHHLDSQSSAVYRKDRKLLKNWRPISLLCVVYKLATTVIANRLKPHLQCIISKNQSGFIKGRRIEEGIRLVYDIMSYTENLIYLAFSC